jgi:propionate CoA-transferase
MRNKVTSAAEAVSLIQDGDTVCTSGFVGVGTPDELLLALEKRFVATCAPRALTLLHAAGQGDGRDRGLNTLAHEGLLKRVVGGHFGLAPKIVQMINDEQIEAYNLPLGVIAHLYRDIAAGRPGTITKVGIGTFVDPRLEGGKLNKRSTEDLVRVMEVDGREWLFYRAIPVNVAFLRGTSADPEGNVSAEHESLDLDNRSMAMAVKNSGGVVIVQVERIVKSKSLHPRRVMIPGALVDCVVVAQPQNHPQTYGTAFNAAFCGEISVPLGGQQPMPLDARKIIARRCAMELRSGAIVNLGIGMPEGIAAVASEERISEYITLTTEAGVIGGVPSAGLDFGAAVNVDAVIEQNQQFDFYDGGGLDIAFLGLAEADQAGNVNVSRFGAKIAGTGGFINISQNARKVVYAGTFTAGNLELHTGDGRLQIVKDGPTCKFREQVSQITFSGRVALESGQPVLYVTERCVFRLTHQGLELIEVAPGIDIERDIVARMPFRPIVGEVREMDKGIFVVPPMGLHDRMLDLPLAERIEHEPRRDILFLNFEGLHLRSVGQVNDLRDAVVAKCRSIGHRVAVVVSYDAFVLEPEIEDHYAAVVAQLERDHYGVVSRYTKSAFMRLKLAQVLTRAVQPHIFENSREAQAFHEPVQSGEERV